MNLEAENKALRERVATLEAHIHAGIHCAFFCALPECAKYQSGETDDTNATRTPRTEVVERASCTKERQPF
jgi:hypothetical protein